MSVTPTSPPSVTSTVGAVGAPESISTTSAQTNQIIKALEPTLKDSRDDIRKLLAAFIAAFLFLILAFGAGYMHLDDKLDAQNDSMGSKVDGVNTRIDSVDSDLSTKLENSNDLLIQVNTQLKDLLARIPPVVARAP